MMVRTDENELKGSAAAKLYVLSRLIAGAQQDTVSSKGSYWFMNKISS